MRPASSRVVTLWITVLCLFPPFSALTVGLRASGGRSTNFRRCAGAGQRSQGGGKPGAVPPPLTTDTWTGTAGDGNWGTAGTGAWERCLAALMLSSLAEPTP